MVLPLSEPIRGMDGTMMHEIFIPKDTTVALGLLSTNRSKAIWGEDAGEWRPERWLEPLPESVTEARVPGIYSNLCVSLSTPPIDLYNAHGCARRMTFLGGGRACM